MKNILWLFFVFWFSLLLFGLGAPRVFAAGNCTGYAWGENVGWINFNPQVGGVTVTDNSLTGYAWGENIGWINFSPTNGGVTNDGNGNLTGYAWGENVGWINFNPSGSQVVINSSGNFTGYAWGENIGWITMSGVQTSWRPGPTPAPQPAPAPEPEPEPSPVDTSFIPEGGLIRAIGDIDVYIVKYMGSKKLKRLVLSPTVFNSYGHLRWENIKDVDQSVVDVFTTSDLVRATVAGDSRVFRLFPSGDTGEKRWIRTETAFLKLGYDWDAVYTINETDRDAYVNGQDIN